MEEIVGLSLRDLVEIFNYKDMNYKDIKDWVATVWDPIIGYKPTFCIFIRVGMGLFFRWEENSTFIIQRTWMKGHSSLILK